MTQPLVAVPAYRLPAGRVTSWHVGCFAVPEPYIEAIRRAGLTPVILPETDLESVVSMLDMFDAILLLGGGDVDPARYGAEAHSEVYGVDPHRDDLEISLVREAVRRDLPTLAVCRGIQVLNVARGGTLLQHVPDLPGVLDHRPDASLGSHPVMHQVEVKPDSRVAEATGRTVLTCASHHHQAVDRLGDGLHVVGRSEDGVVEAIEGDDGWLVAVQWHPELTAADDPTQQALFDALAERARERSRVRAGAPA
ncbi:MAG: gamma-glutamyl-gamma-aminobutyrate hydrolase family protein [Actinomycetota bacterium]|nr:gamma-glutamyl-gamma-aminobutyrate hydrolase family protein [Actinomycetota bacterium]